MGYYDQDYERNESGNRHGRRGGRGGWFLAGLLGAIIGVLVAALVFPALGIMSPNSANATPNQTKQQPQGKTINKTVNVDVNTAAEKAVAKVSSAVVGVINYQSGGFFNDQSQAQPEGLGSGVVYKKENGKAYIVTNNHVVEGATKLEVSLKNNKSIPASLVGTDPVMDLAVITVNADKVNTVAEFGNSDDLKRAEPVVAIGNPLGFSGTVTKGIVSSKNRTVPRDIDGDGQPDWTAQVIQTDAAINPGNSGGALINLEGQVVGINSMKISETSVEGIGFAIPINSVKPIIAELEKYGKVVRPFIGIYYKPLSVFPAQYRKKLFNLPADVDSGLVVHSVKPGGPAEQAGLKPQDVIVTINGKKIKNALEFKHYLYTKLNPGDEVKFDVYRNGHKMTVTVKLGQSS
ncbi:MAG TPA: trypsin-like peptidase domain-containing protein [Bacillales bacterium]|nr:trypsin-like peptidase domain-containing protein [Bacillales bacterium]